MGFVIDVHLHSRYARATSRDLNPENLHRWSALKGLDVVGTGDYTHPAWFAELQEKLEPAEEGLYRLGQSFRAPVDSALPETCRREVRFLLSVEISSIYKKNGRTRKIHNVVILPSLASVVKLNRRLGAMGNLKADGRPILGLDSRDLLEICLEVDPRVLFVPAHIWTPHFAVLGSSSGFDSLEECFEDLLPHIFAVETGLSSDPPMNWRLSGLDRFAIVSNSDAHSPQKLAREATCFEGELSYGGIYEALKDRDSGKFTGTLEFYPEEGKYHWDGHRKCQVRWKPAQTLAAEGLCPECGRPLTVGVLHRVELLADRPEGFRPRSAPSFEYLIPLDEVIAAALGMGPGSKKVQGVYQKLLAALGPELQVLRQVEVQEIARCGEPLVAEGVRRMRQGQVEIHPGYDGEYGKISLFTEAERQDLKGQAGLFDLGAVPARAEGASGKPAKKQVFSEEAEVLPSPLRTQALDPAQSLVVQAKGGPLVVVAGPGAGKTRVLAYRVAHLIREQGVPPGQIMAITFTNRAAGEMRQRLESLLKGTTGLEQMRVGTFHRAALDLLRECGAGQKAVLDEVEARQALEQALAEASLEGRPAALQEAISLAKAAGLGPQEVEEALRPAYTAYQEVLKTYEARDYDDILLDLLCLLEGDGEVLAKIQRRFPFLLVDEFQDLNPVQYRLVRQLAGKGEGLLVIGDPDQAIYGFRGARPHFFAQVRQDFPAAQVFHLGTNYRSPDQIVRAAAAVIAHNGGRQDLELKAARKGRGRLRLLVTASETAEGIALVREISRMVGGADMVQADQHGQGWRSFSDFGVLFRTTRQARVLEECFLKEGLPYCLVGQKGFLEAPGVRAALAFARYVVRPDDPWRRRRALELEPFRPPESALRAMGQLREGDGPAGGAGKTSALEEAAARYRTIAGERGAIAFFHQWQEEYGHPGDPDLEPLFSLASEAASLEAVLQTVLLGQEADYARRSQAGRGEAVPLLTLHAAKGLEFPVVFIAGVEEGLIPFGEKGADLEEERRLFYVGMTRASEELVLLCARHRTRHGKRVQLPVSPFVKEIPAELLKEEKVELPKKGQAQQLSLF